LQEFYKSSLPLVPIYELTEKKFTGLDNLEIEQQMIYADGLTKIFGVFTAVDGLTFQVKDGEIFGLLGTNGAGKTTKIRMLACLITKTAGNAIIDSFSISNRDKENHWFGS
jgi:ABC-type multidrug transport system ATPase subunit